MEGMKRFDQKKFNKAKEELEKGLINVNRLKFKSRNATFNDDFNEFIRNIGEYKFSTVNRLNSLVENLINLTKSNCNTENKKQIFQHLQKIALKQKTNLEGKNTHYINTHYIIKTLDEILEKIKKVIPGTVEGGSRLLSSKSKGVSLEDKIKKCNETKPDSFKKPSLKVHKLQPFNSLTHSTFLTPKKESMHQIRKVVNLLLALHIIQYDLRKQQTKILDDKIAKYLKNNFAKTLKELFSSCSNDLSSKLKKLEEQKSTDLNSNNKIKEEIRKEARFLYGCNLAAYYVLKQLFREHTWGDAATFIETDLGKIGNYGKSSSQDLTLEQYKDIIYRICANLQLPAQQIEPKNICELIKRQAGVIKKSDFYKTIDQKKSDAERGQKPSSSNAFQILDLGETMEEVEELTPTNFKEEDLFCNNSVFFDTSGDTVSSHNHSLTAVQSGSRSTSRQPNSSQTETDLLKQQLARLQTMMQEEQIKFEAFKSEISGGVALLKNSSTSNSPQVQEARKNLNQTLVNSLTTRKTTIKSIKELIGIVEKRIEKGEMSQKKEFDNLKTELNKMEKYIDGMTLPDSVVVRPITRNTHQRGPLTSTSGPIDSGSIDKSFVNEKDINLGVVSPDNFYQSYYEPRKPLELVPPQYEGSSDFLDKEEDLSISNPEILSEQKIGNLERMAKNLELWMKNNGKESETQKRPGNNLSISDLSTKPLTSVVLPTTKQPEKLLIDSDNRTIKQYLFGQNFETLEACSLLKEEDSNQKSNYGEVEDLLEMSTASDTTEIKNDPVATPLNLVADGKPTSCSDVTGSTNTGNSDKKLPLKDLEIEKIQNKPNPSQKNKLQTSYQEQFIKKFDKSYHKEVSCPSFDCTNIRTPFSPQKTNSHLLTTYNTNRVDLVEKILNSNNVGKPIQKNKNKAEKQFEYVIKQLKSSSNPKIQIKSLKSIKTENYNSKTKEKIEILSEILLKLKNLEEFFKDGKNKIDYFALHKSYVKFKEDFNKKINNGDCSVADENNLEEAKKLIERLEKVKVSKKAYEESLEKLREKYKRLRENEARLKCLNFKKTGEMLKDESNNINLGDEYHEPLKVKNKEGTDKFGYLDKTSNEIKAVRIKGSKLDELVEKVGRNKKFIDSLKENYQTKDIVATFKKHYSITFSKDGYKEDEDLEKRVIINIVERAALRSDELKLKLLAFTLAGTGISTSPEHSIK